MQYAQTPMNSDMRVVCAWCQRVIRPGPDERTSHGLCLTCAEQHDLLDVERLEDFSRDELNRLPMGYVALDAAGCVLEYNAAEAELAGVDAEAVLGRNFFTDVAPCTQVREFEGEFRKLVQANELASHEVNFVFRFSRGAVMVVVDLTWQPELARGALIVRVQQDSEAEGSPAA